MYLYGKKMATPTVKMPLKAIEFWITMQSEKYT